MVVIALLAPAMDGARAASEPREGHFAAPDDLAAAPFAASTSVIPSYYQTSEYMIGRVAVGLILPESIGTTDPELNDWTLEQRQRVLDEVTQGLTWWADQSPDAHFTFVIDDHATNPLPTAYEPISHPQDEEGTWIGDTLSRLGYTNGLYWTRVRDYVNDLRDAYHTDWAFAIFVVNSEGDADGAFADGYFAYAYLGGPFFVMTYNNAGYGIEYMDAVAAHETGHVFRALDQYAAANVKCATRSGYLGVETQNSQRSGCASDVPSIMRGGIYPYLTRAIDPYGRGQVGWQDSDADGIFDPVDTLPTLSVDTVTHADAEWSYTGRANDPAYPSPLRPRATINDVSVEYSLDGGAWTSTTPIDGQFDSPDESFGVNLSLTASGNHRVALRAHNSAGNVSAAAEFFAVVPDPIDGGLDTWLEPPVADWPGGSSASVVHGLASSFNADGTPGAAIARVEYRINGGDWLAARAQDGAFDAAEEGFSLPLDRSGGAHGIEARAIDASGAVEQNVAHIQVNRTYAVFVPIAHR
jgi:hypothetical protein